MRFKLDQVCYLANGFSGFCKAMGLDPPIKCKIKSYDIEKDEYEVGVIEKQPKVSRHELKYGNYMEVQHSHTLIGVTSKQLMGVVCNENP